MMARAFVGDRFGGPTVSHSSLLTGLALAPRAAAMCSVPPEPAIAEQDRDVHALVLLHTPAAALTPQHGGRRRDIERQYAAFPGRRGEKRLDQTPESLTWSRRQ